MVQEGCGEGGVVKGGRGKVGDGEARVQTPPTEHNQ